MILCDLHFLILSILCVCGRCLCPWWGGTGWALRSSPFWFGWNHKSNSVCTASNPAAFIGLGNIPDVWIEPLKYSWIAANSLWQGAASLLDPEGISSHRWDYLFTEYLFPGLFLQKTAQWTKNEVWSDFIWEVWWPLMAMGFQGELGFSVGLLGDLLIFLRKFCDGKIEE